MASAVYYCNNLQHIVYQPESELEIFYPTPPFVQIELNMAVQFGFGRYHCLTDQFVHLDNKGMLFSHEPIRFNLRALKSYDRIYQILGPMLVRLRINPNGRSYHAIIEEIIRKGVSIGTLESNKGRQVLPLQALLWGTLVEHVNEEEEVLIERALEESASDFESSNYNMVPAKKSSVKKMLKRVRVEAAECDKKGEEKIKKRRLEAENCVICLEELKVGSVASRMPCSHIFHGDCIEKWLKQSHYCPVCRFEMPTE